MKSKKKKRKIEEKGGIIIKITIITFLSSLTYKFATSIQHLCAQGPGDCGSAVRFGRALSGYPIPVHHLYAFPAVIGVLAMWWYNKPQTKNQYAKVRCHDKTGAGLSPSDFLRKKIKGLVVAVPPIVAFIPTCN